MTVKPGGLWLAVTWYIAVALCSTDLVIVDTARGDDTVHDGVTAEDTSRGGAFYEHMIKRDSDLAGWCATVRITPEEMTRLRQLRRAGWRAVAEGNVVSFRAPAPSPGMLVRRYDGREMIAQGMVRDMEVKGVQ